MIKFVLALAALGATAMAAPVTGNVLNKTTNKPAAGADVVVSRVTEGLPEVTRVKTDAKGNFTINIPDTDANQPHLIRVEYGGANYPKFAPPGTQSVSIDVYDAAKQVEGITGSADILAFQTVSDKELEIIETYVVRNESNPPRTQLSERAFELYLPEAAKIENAAAGRAGGMPVNTAPVPQSEKGKYAFIYPLRPGETLFRITYRLPYSGKLDLKPRLTMPMENFVVMMPPGMKLDPKSSGFNASADENGMHVAVVKAVQPTDRVEYEVSGSGKIPERADENQPAQAPADNAGNLQRTAPGGGLGAPIQAPNPLDRYKWWIFAAVALALIAGAGYVMGRPQSAKPGRDQLLAALKEELFRLESDRAQGKLTDAEYQEYKSAMDIVLRRAVAAG